MMTDFQKPEDRIKYQLGDLLWHNLVIVSENERLARENAELKAKADKAEPKPE